MILDASSTGEVFRLAAAAKGLRAVSRTPVRTLPTRSPTVAHRTVDIFADVMTAELLKRLISSSCISSDR